MIFEVECDTTKRNEFTDRTDTMIVPFIVLDNINQRTGTETSTVTTAST